ncbi:hypothetical protein Tco_0343817 [Tanacetum coccineum]
MGEGTIAQTRSERVPTPSYDSPLLGGNTPRSDEERLEQHELTNNVPPTPHDSPLPGEGLESDLMKIKKLYATAFKELISRVKSLEDEEDFVAKDPSKQGRSLIVEMDLDAGIPLVPPHVEVQGRYGQNLETQEEVTTTDAELNTASTFVSTASPQRNADTTADDLTLAETLMEIRKSAAKDNTDEEFFQQLQACEKCSEEDLPMKLVELVNQRKKFFAQQRAKANRKKPMTPAIQKDYMSNYIKNQEGGYSIKQLKSLSFEQVKEIFETTMGRVQSFVHTGSDLEVQRLKRACQEVLEEPVKRQNIGEALGSGEEQSAKKEKKLSEEELQKLLVIVPVEELVIQPFQVRYPIIDWEVYSKDTRRYWRIIRVKLKRLFKPDNDDIIWKLKKYMHDPLVWRLYDTCGVYHVSSVRGHDIFMLSEKEYPLTRGTLGLMMVARLLVKADSEMSRELLRKIFYQVNHKFREGLLGIRGFYNLMLLVQVCAAAED